MNEEQLIATLQACYFGDRGAFNKILKEYKKLQQENEEYKEVIDKIDKKINDFIKCCKAEKIESGSDFLHHSYWNMFENFNKQIKEILKEVKNDCE